MTDYTGPKRIHVWLYPNQHYDFPLEDGNVIIPEKVFETFLQDAKNVWRGASTDEE